MSVESVVFILQTNLFQMKVPIRCTLLLRIFISPSPHVSGNYVTTNQENLLYLRDSGIFHSVRVAVLSADWDETHLGLGNFWFLC